MSLKNKLYYFDNNDQTIKCEEKIISIKLNTGFSEFYESDNEIFEKIITNKFIKNKIYPPDVIVNSENKIYFENIKLCELLGKNSFLQEIKTSKSINDIHSSSPQISLADQFGQQPIIDLKKEIGINERYLMTENLFSGDSEAFTNAITQLNQLNNHNDALDYLKKELSKKYNWNLKSNHVKRLFKLVERRYQ